MKAPSFGGNCIRSIFAFVFKYGSDIEPDKNLHALYTLRSAISSYSLYWKNIGYLSVLEG